jgi:hypothetical protein
MEIRLVFLRRPLRKGVSMEKKLWVTFKERSEYNWEHSPPKLRTQ